MPPPGSFKDRVLEELAFRHRMERYVEMTMLLTTLGHGLRVPEEHTQKLLELYERILNHRAFLPGVLDELAVDKKTWDRDSINKALDEVAKW